ASDAQKQASQSAPDAAAPAFGLISDRPYIKFDQHGNLIAKKYLQRADANPKVNVRASESRILAVTKIAAAGGNHNGILADEAYAEYALQQKDPEKFMLDTPVGMSADRNDYG